MRKKRSLIPYFQICIVLVLVLSLSRGMSERLRGITVAMIAPVWQQSNLVKRSVQHLADNPASDPQKNIKYASDEIQKLKLENQLLLNEIDRLVSILSQESFLEEQRRQFMTQDANETLKQLALLHKKDLQNLIKKQLQAVPAQVIFRSPSLWNSTLWINVGNKNNVELGKTVVAKNSPVMAGACLVGIIDFVGDRQSRVRLITDTGLTPSVRAVREIDGKVWRLAKGEMRGSLGADWRRQSLRLRGLGFNYDFGDGEGPARDLRTGIPVGGAKIPALPIIDRGDLLVTTGMDGVFPPGMLVAWVTHLTPLKEGDYTYEIEAEPAAGHLDSLSLVFVLPPSGYADVYR